MLDFEETFDAKDWIKEHGLPAQGRSFQLLLDASHLGETMKIPSCASWEFTELDVAQAMNKHQGFRGTIGDILEKARRDIADNKDMYGEAAAAKFDSVLQRIDGVLEGGVDTVTLTVYDPSGLCSVSEELLKAMTEDTLFDRSANERMLLQPALELEASEPIKQLTSAKEIAELVHKSTRVAGLTGAGISVESGITPFRNPSDGDKNSIWGNFDAGKLNNQNFNANPDAQEGWWRMKRSVAKEAVVAEPNPAHKFFTMLEEQDKLGAVVTQNIDSLHQKAGVSSEKVIELHGHMHGLICSDNETVLNPLPYRSGTCTFCIPPDDVDAVHAVYFGDEAQKIPLCPDCGCPLRSEVVMFGQPMPLHAMDAACNAIDEADLLFVIGSTLIVQPANELPAVAIRNKVPVVIINFDNTQYDKYATGLVRQKAGEFLAEVMHELKQMSQFPAPTRHQLPQKVAKPQQQSPEEMTEKRIAKEASKLGKDIFNNASACGMSFFCTAVSQPQGDFGLLQQSLEMMNLECESIGKMLFSDCADQLAVISYVPEVHAGVVKTEEWLQAVAKAIGGQVLDTDATSGKLVVRAAEAASDPINLKDIGVTAAIQFLKDKGLFPEVEDEDIIYGEEDFPL